MSLASHASSLSQLRHGRQLCHQLVFKQSTHQNSSAGSPARRRSSTAALRGAYSHHVSARQRSSLASQNIHGACFCSATKTDSSPSVGRIKYLYDGQCKVCTTFKSALQVEEQDKERIDFVNIAEDSFDPKQHNGISYDDAMSTIHAITLEGKTVKGPDAVKELFAAAGPRLGVAAGLAKLPGFAQIFGFLYKQLSIYRFPISKAATKAKETVGKE